MDADPLPASALPPKGAWCVYMLRCADGTLYAGATNDLSARLARHGAGKGAAYTRARLPVSLAWWEAAADRSAALRREAAIKRLGRPAKIALASGMPAASPDVDPRVVR